MSYTPRLGFGGTPILCPKGILPVAMQPATISIENEQTIDTYAFGRVTHTRGFDQSVPRRYNDSIVIQADSNSGGVDSAGIAHIFDLRQYAARNTPWKIRLSVVGYGYALLQLYETAPDTPHSQISSPVHRAAIDRLQHGISSKGYTIDGVQQTVPSGNYIDLTDSHIYYRGFLRVDFSAYQECNTTYTEAYGFAASIVLDF